MSFATFFSSGLILCSILVIVSKNPVHSVLYLILSFCNAAGIFFYLGAEFLAISYIVVYMGAIAVLFLFIVMMLHIEIVPHDEIFKRYLPVILFVVSIIFTQLTVFLFIVNNDSVFSITKKNWSDYSFYISNIESIGSLIYVYFPIIFILSGFILLVAMIGSIAITLQQQRFIKRQNVFEQIGRDFKTAVILWK